MEPHITDKELREFKELRKLLKESGPIGDIGLSHFIKIITADTDEKLKAVLIDLVTERDRPRKIPDRLKESWR